MKNNTLKNIYYMARIISRINNWKEIKSTKDFDEAYESVKILNQMESTRFLLEMDKTERTEFYKYMKEFKRK